MHALSAILGIEESKLQYFAKSDDEKSFRFGLHSSGFNQLIRFEAAAGRKFYIDFSVYPIRTDGWYIVPAHHYYYLPFDSSIRLISFSVSEMWHADYRTWLWRLKYNESKFIKHTVLSQPEKEGILSDPIPHLAPILEDLMMTQHRHRMIDSLTLNRATLFLDRLTEVPPRNDNSYVREFAMSIAMSDRNFQRMSRIVFGKSPHDILKYHLLVQIANAIIRQPEGLIKEFAMRFGFEHESSFLRFLKQGLHIRPSDIRREFCVTH